MSKALLWWLLGIWVIGSVATHVGYIKRIGWQNAARLAPIRVADGPRWQTRLPGALFRRVGMQLNPAAQLPLEQVAAYLRQHPAYRLTVTGTYTADEALATLAPDLGKARADVVIARLATAGVPARQLYARSERNDALAFVNDSTGALVFLFNPLMPVTVQSLANAQRYVDLWHPMELYFELGRTVYIRTPETKRFAQAAVAYLRVHRRAVLLATGHTDSLGSATRNLTLSWQRANTVKKNLTQLGIRAGQVRVQGLGEDNPVAPNATPAGRLANRRVSIVVQR